jgi:hypothetical protein
MPIDLGLEGFDEVEEIGRGAFGTVYRAHQVDFDRTVAIKVLTGVHDEQARSRFDRERRALGALSSHPNIVQVFAAGVATNGDPYLVMAFARNGSLAERITEEGAMTADAAVDMGAKLGDGLAAAHAAGVLHRDVKPENVLFSGYGEPMLADFGIARLADGPATRTGMVTASVMHAPPEILDGARPSEAADVYSLASTVYTAIHGRPPFSRESDASLIPVIGRISTEAPPDLRADGVPAPVCDVLERGLAKEPAERPTATEFAQSLRAAVGGAPAPVPAPAAPPAPTPAQATPAPRSGSTVVTLVVGAILVLAGVLMLTGLFPSFDTTGSADADFTSSWAQYGGLGIVFLVAGGLIVALAGSRIAVFGLAAATAIGLPMIGDTVEFVRLLHDLDGAAGFWLETLSVTAAAIAGLLALNALLRQRQLRVASPRPMNAGLAAAAAAFVLATRVVNPFTFVGGNRFGSDLGDQGNGELASTVIWMIAVLLVLALVASVRSPWIRAGLAFGLLLHVVMFRVAAGLVMFALGEGGSGISPTGFYALPVGGAIVLAGLTAQSLRAARQQAPVDTA